MTDIQRSLKFPDQDLYLWIYLSVHLFNYLIIFEACLYDISR